MSGQGDRNSGFSLPELALRRPVTTVMGLVSLVILGATAVWRLPVAFMPPIERPEIEVSADHPNLPAWAADEQVARPLEGELEKIPGYRRISTHIRWGSTEIDMQFDWDIDIDLKKAEVREAVERVRPTLPDDVVQLSVGAEEGGHGGRAVVSGRIASGRNLSESYDLIELKILRPIERIPGVANVELAGVDPKRVNIELDPEALQRHNLTAGEVMAVLDDANIDIAAGVLRGEGLRRPVRGEAAFRSVEEIRELPVRPGLRIRDLGEVRYEEPPRWIGRHLNGNFAVGLEVFKEPTANTVEVVERIEGVVAQINADPSMRGIEFLIWHNEAEEIKKSLGGLRNAGIVGGILAVIVLMLFLRRLQTTLIVAIAIPFSLISSCAFLYLLGRELNVMALLGLMLGVGMLVDNSVVVIENIHRRREAGEDPRRAARIGAKEVSLAVTAATATTLCVWLPFFLGERSEMTIMVGEIAVAMCLTIGSSLLISLTFIPLAASRLSRREKRPAPSRLQSFLRRGYAWLLRFGLRHRGVTLVILLALCASAAWPFMKLEKDPEPRFQEPDVRINFEMAGTFPPERTEEMVEEVEQAVEPLRDELGFDYVYSWFGEGYAGVRVFWPREKASEETLDAGAEALKEVLPAIPGVKLRIGEENWNWRRNRFGGGEQARFPILLYGEESSYLAAKAVELESLLLPIPGVEGVSTQTWDRSDEMHVVVDQDAALQRGVTPQQIAQSVGNQFRGRTIRRLKAGDKEIDVFLAMKGWDQEGWARLQDLRVPRNEGGEPVPLAGVADFRRAPGRNFIRKEGGKIHWVVMVEYDREKRAEVMAAVQQRMRGFPLAEGASWELGGRDERREEWGRMLTGLLLALLLVYVVMASLFESSAQPLAIIVSLPLAAAGAFWVLWLVGARFDMPAYIGCIVLLGIVVNNGIVLIDHVNQYRRAGLAFEEALLRGCEERLRPILMTALTTILGLLPMAMGRFTVANVYIDTMAWAVMGGLTSSTLLTLIALPTWASVLHDVAVAARRAERATRATDASPEPASAA